MCIGGAIYISLPSVGNQSGDSWNYLGYVSNDKPSGTFKIDNLKRMAQSNMESSFGHSYSGPQIGVTVKSLNELSNLTPGISLNYEEYFLYSNYSREPRCEQYDEENGRKSVQLCNEFYIGLEVDSDLDH